MKVWIHQYVKLFSWDRAIWKSSAVEMRYRKRPRSLQQHREVCQSFFHAKLNFLVFCTTIGSNTLRGMSPWVLFEVMFKKLPFKASYWVRRNGISSKWSKTFEKFRYKTYGFGRIRDRTINNTMLVLNPKTIHTDILLSTVFYWTCSLPTGKITSKPWCLNENT